MFCLTRRNQATRELKDTAMQITVTIKNVYGNETIYPACVNSRIFADMLNQKTLTRRDLAKIHALGYEIVTEAPEFNFAVA